MTGQLKPHQKDSSDFIRRNRTNTSSLISWDTS